MHFPTKSIIRYLFVVLLGIFLHFAYQLSGENLIVGLFATVNESIWEHLKLVFYPMLVLTLWDLFTTQSNDSQFLVSRTKGTLAGIVFVIVVYYTVTGIIGTNIDWINITVYLLAMAFVFWTERKSQSKHSRLTIRAVALIWLLFIILFTTFTLTPPTLGIFIPPTL